jgi:hypothetical protein
VRSMLHILKSTGFKHARCDDGRKFLMEMQWYFQHKGNIPASNA